MSFATLFVTMVLFKCNGWHSKRLLWTKIAREILVECNSPPGKPGSPGGPGGPGGQFVADAAHAENLLFNHVTVKIN